MEFSRENRCRIDGKLKFSRWNCVNTQTVHQSFIQNLRNFNLSWWHRNEFGFQEQCHYFTCRGIGWKWEK